MTTDIFLKAPDYEDMPEEWRLDMKRLRGIRKTHEVRIREIFSIQKLSQCQKNMRTTGSLELLPNLWSRFEGHRCAVFFVPAPPSEMAESSLGLKMSGEPNPDCKYKFDPNELEVGKWFSTYYYEIILNISECRSESWLTI